jgi:hypothetical protein
MYLPLINHYFKFLLYPWSLRFSPETLCVTRTGYLAMGIEGQTMGCTFLFTEDCPDVSIPALEYAGFGSVPYRGK